MTRLQAERPSRDEEAAERFLRLLAAGLLNEIYLDHELRLVHLSESLRDHREPDRSKLGDPVREMPVRWHELFDHRHHGIGPGAHQGRRLPYAESGAVLLAHLRSCLDLVRNEKIDGDFVDCGPGRGGAGMFMRGYCDAYGLDGTRVWVVDEFRVRPATDDPLDVWTDLHAVRDGYARFQLLDDRVRFVEGRSRDAFSHVDGRLALVRLGRGSGPETEGALEALHARMAPGGIMIVDEADRAERQEVVARFCAAHPEVGPPGRVGSARVWWHTPRATNGAAAGARPASLVRRTTEVTSTVATKDLSVVVVAYNMRREASRTLLSLSRAYQRGIDDLEYEVLVVENGSAPEHTLGEDFVRSFGPEFRYLDLGADARPSPVHALNHGLDASIGATVAFMIDGAHVLTPGVLHYAIAGLRTYAPAVVLTQLFYVGPGQQPETVRDGYNQPLEDELFDQIEWPADGYRLFDIGHFVGDRDWFDGMWESNCIFVPRSLLVQSGGYDDRFRIPGGGFANPEFYERLARTPDVKVVTMLGEGSFHQVHGGTTTNADPHDRAAARFEYVDEFRTLLGRQFRGAGKRVHYVGAMYPGAARTRARRGDASVFTTTSRERHPDDVAGVPIPDDLKSSFTEAFWHSGRWRDATWLGLPTMQAPTDLFVYQELVARLRPDWIIETGAAPGQTLLFASICELLDHGEVVSIAATEPSRVQHRRVHYVDGPPTSADTLERVRSLAGAATVALVVLGGATTANELVAEFAAYRSFVTPGSYAVIEHTAMNGRPVVTGPEDGPYEAVRRIVAGDREFVIDTELERYGLTFNPIGYLKRKQ